MKENNEKTEKADKTKKVEKADKTEKVEKSEKSEKVDKTESVYKLEKPRHCRKCRDGKEIAAEKAKEIGLFQEYTQTSETFKVSVGRRLKKEFEGFGLLVVCTDNSGETINVYQPEHSHEIKCSLGENLFVKGNFENQKRKIKKKRNEFEAKSTGKKNGSIYWETEVNKNFQATKFTVMVEPKYLDVNFEIITHS